MYSMQLEKHSKKGKVMFTQQGLIVSVHYTKTDTCTQRRGMYVNCTTAWLRSNIIVSRVKGKIYVRILVISLLTFNLF